MQSGSVNIAPCDGAAEASGARGVPCRAKILTTKTFALLKWNRKKGSGKSVASLRVMGRNAEPGSWKEEEGEGEGGGGWTSSLIIR